MRKKTGPPSEFKPEYCQKLIDHMAEGYSFESFAGVIGRCKQTIYTWLDRHPEFQEARGIATEACRLHWERLGIQYVVNVTESDRDAKTSISKSLNGAVWSLNMRNRFPKEWKDKQPEEVDKTTVNVSSMSKEELKEIVKNYYEQEIAGKK